MPIIRQIADNSKTGPAISAIGKGVPVSAVSAIPQISQACFTNAHIRRDKGVFGAITTWQNNKKIT